MQASKLISVIALLPGIALAQHEPGCLHLSLGKKALKQGVRPDLLATIEGTADTDVLHNTLNLTLAPPSNVLSASTQISAESKHLSLSEFTFRLSDTFTIGQVLLDGRPISITRLDPSTVRANFDQPYTIGQVFTLDIPYSGPAVSAFFGSIAFGTRAASGPYCFSLSEPWYAYTWWPNKDDNTDKATFDINVTVPSSLSAVSNGVLLGVDNVGGGQNRYRWSTDYPMAPYLAMIAVSDYNTWTTPFDFGGQNMPIQYWIWPDQDNGTNRASWEKAVPMMTAFNDAFGEYPFKEEKYSMYQFTFGGGMEHQTATGMGGFWESVVAHELAHHWWGDMITCATWHDIWLNEGFATYAEAVWQERRVGGSFAAYKAEMAGNRPSQTSGTVYCNDISDPNRIFSGSYSYNKGAWALHQLRRVMGDTKFFAALAQYRDTFLYQTATTEDFISVCEDVYGADLHWFFNKVVYGTGVPVFQWNWSTTTANGKNYLLVYVRQTQNTSHGVFALPIDIRPTVGGVQQQKAVFSDALTENFVIPLSGAATACTFDEDIWTLNGGVTTTTFVSGGPVLVEATPAPGTKVMSAPQIQLTFQSTVTTNAGHFTIETAGSFDTRVRSVKVPFTFAYNSSTKTVTLTPTSPLRSGKYTVTISDQVRSTSGNRQLDGEFKGSLPSGNGEVGGITKYTFTHL
ncbi:MAG: Ig-like domain-containing protein [Chthonomonas sp.]|nr:Ig-like domain-containing protein [Chthonomonas sp.]